LIERTTEVRQVEEVVFKYFIAWVRSGVFLDQALSRPIRITFLQVVFLLIQVPNSMSFFKQSDAPL